jgi:hypothetical protein
MRKKQSASKAYLKGKKLLVGQTLDFTLQSLLGESLGLECYDSILLENIPENLSKGFWEDIIHVSRVALKTGCVAYAVLPRFGKILLPFEIIRENSEFTIYKISK